MTSISPRLSKRKNIKSESTQPTTLPQTEGQSANVQCRHVWNHEIKEWVKKKPEDAQPRIDQVIAQKQKLLEKQGRSSKPGTATAAAAAAAADVVP